VPSNSDERQREARTQPVRRHLAQHDQRQRTHRQQQLLEGAVLVVVGEQAAQRQHRREQRRHPHHPGRHRAQQLRFGANAQRKQAGDDHEEEQRCGGVGPAAHREPQVAQEDTAHRIQRGGPGGDPGDAHFASGFGGGHGPRGAAHSVSVT
jgi:hypothetical protein